MSASSGAVSTEGSRFENAAFRQFSGFLFRRAAITEFISAGFSANGSQLAAPFKRSAVELRS
jgi:hypothetical protein